MISKIKINNFQIHKSLEVELDPHLTCFVGPSKKGKSSIFRAFRWLFLNQAPKGTFISFDEDKCLVSAVMDDIKLTRTKSKKSNSYKLGKNKFNAFGRGKVPRPVEEFLNIGEENFQKQLDPHFWFSDSPGQISKNLNRIINLEIIDKVLQEAKSQVRKNDLAIEISKERIASLSREKTRLKPILKLARKQAKIGVKLERLESKRKTLRETIAAVKNIEILQVKIRSLKDKSEGLDGIDFDKVNKLTESIRFKQKELEAVQDSLSQITELEEEICAKQRSLKETERKLAKVKKCPTCGQTIR